jgi:hypothetical protein
LATAAIRQSAFGYCEITQCWCRGYHLLERVRLDILLDEMHKAGFQRESKIWLSTRYTHVMAITEMRVRGITTNAV